MYVPIKLSDWDDSDELEEEFAEDDDAGKDMPQLVEEEDEQHVLEIGEVTGVEEDLFEGKLDGGLEGVAVDVDEDDNRLRECHEDMSMDGSLEGEDVVVGAALSLEDALKVFNSELKGKNGTKRET